MLTPSQKEELKKELQPVKTAQDLFEFLSTNYDLKAVELGIITKPAMIKGVIDIISSLNAKKKVNPNIRVNRS